MKITAKATDVNDIFADVSVTIISALAIGYCSDDCSSSYPNISENIVYIYCFGRYFHCEMRTTCFSGALFSLSTRPETL